MISPTWHRCGIVVLTQGGPRPVEGWRMYDGAALVVTPQLTDTLLVTDERFVITLFQTGVRLWPNDFTLIEAMTICAELLQLPGWESYQENARLIEAATAIVQRRLRAIA